MFNNTKRKSYVLITIFTIVMTSFFISCKEESRGSVNFINDPEVVPMMYTDSVDMVISSDSGFVKYRLITAVWEIYNTPKDSYWLFPKKAHFEQYDTLGNVVATVDADTIWNYDKQKLWKLKGNVVIKNNEGVICKSNEIFWNQRTQRVYSDKYVEIHQPNKGTLRGRDGFEADQYMTEWTFYKLIDSELLVTEKENEDQDKQGDKRSVE